MNTRKLLGVIDTFTILIVMMVSLVCVYAQVDRYQNLSTAHFKYVNYTFLKLYKKINFLFFGRFLKKG